MSRPRALHWLTSFVYGVVMRIVALVLFSRVAAHLRFFVGLARLPGQRPLILAPNHQSYFDGHVIAFFMWLLYGERALTVTNVKAIRGPLSRLYHGLARDVIVDPNDVVGTYERLKTELAAGRTLIIYPEGHRSTDGALLPFRYGAFNIAADLGVPILPIALRGTRDVLEKGSLWFKRGAKASVAFGHLVRPDDFAGEAGGDKRLQARLMMDRTRSTLEALLAPSDAALLEGGAIEFEADGLAQREIDAIERLLDRGAETITASDALSVMRITRLAHVIQTKTVALEVQHLRAFGFLVGALPKVFALFLLGRYRGVIESLLRKDARQPYVNYVHGQYLMRVPRLLGGDKVRAALAMQTAYDSAPSYGIDPSRFAVNYAAALASAGRSQESAALLARHFASGPQSHSERHVRRWNRARALQDRLEGRREAPPAPPHHAA